MIKFNLLLILTLTFFTACNSSESSSTHSLKSEAKICPKCNMEVAKSYIHSASLVKNGTIQYFDDIGCMILWSKENDIDTSKAKVFSKDTARFIDAVSASYTIGEKTPMSYGFAAYENGIQNQIDFDEVNIKMLRGEHMANPKIRKQILGY
jgi:copper chaperone NosL